MPRSSEMYGASAKQEGSSLDDLRRDVSATREVFAKQRTHDARARKSAGAPKIKGSGGFSSFEQTAYEEKLREYRKAVLEASKSESDPKKKSALLREALIDTTVKEADELWSAQRRMKAEAKGGSGAWEKMSQLAHRTVEGYRHLSWKQKLAISGALLVGANTGIPLVMGGAAAGIAAQRILSAGSAAMGIDALVKRFGIDRSRINEILGKDIRKEKDPVVLAEKLSALLEDENNGLNAQVFGIEGRKTREVVLRGAASAAIFGSVLFGLPAKAIGKGVEHVVGDQIRAARSVAGRAVHKMAGFFVGSAEGSTSSVGATVENESLLSKEAKDQLRRGMEQARLRNRMGFTEDSAVTAKGGVPAVEEKLALEKVRAGARNRIALNDFYGGSEDRVVGLKADAPASTSPKGASPNVDRLSFKLSKGGSVEGTINQYFKAHVEEIKAHPELRRALGWDGDPKHIGAASHRLWLEMVDDVRLHPDAVAHKRLIERLEQAGFHVKEAIKDTQHPERLTKVFDAAARRMPIGMEFTINPKTGALEFPDPHVGKVTGGIHEAADSTGKKMSHGSTGRVSSRLQEMLDKQHWQETRESMARFKQNIDELKQSTQDAVDRAADEQEIRHLEKRAELSAQGDIEQAASALKRGDLQLQKIFLPRERVAWLADKSTRVEDVLRQIPHDYDIGRGGAGIDINLPHQNENPFGAPLRQIKLAKYLREALERSHLRFDEAGIPKDATVRNMNIPKILSKINPQTGVFENTRS